MDKNNQFQNSKYQYCAGDSKMTCEKVADDKLGAAFGSKAVSWAVVLASGILSAYMGSSGMVGGR